jgi:hypothetical protein
VVSATTTPPAFAAFWSRPARSGVSPSPQAATGRIASNLACSSRRERLVSGPS